MLVDPPTPEQLRTSFEHALQSIINGAKDIQSDTGLDDQTCEVLYALAAQPDPKRDTDITACRMEFARQLDGTHEKEGWNLG